MRGLCHCELFRHLFVREDGETVSPSARVESIDALISQLLRPLVNENVELFVYRMQFDLKAFDTFSPPVGMPVLTNAVGESVWFSTRSFMDGNETHLRAIEPMLPGEVRHVFVTTTVPEAVFRVGQTTLVVAYFPDQPFEPPELQQHVEPNSHAVFGLSIYPILFPNRRLTQKQRKKRAHIHGYPPLFCQSSDVKTRRQNQVVVATYKDTSLYVLAEWALGASKSGKYAQPPSVLPQITDLEFAQNLKMFETRSDAHLKVLEETDAHKRDKLAAESITSRAGAIETANIIAEFTTLGAFVDILASGSVASLPFQAFSDPFQFATFLACSLFAAAMPVQLRRRVGAVVDSEDDRVVLELMTLYHAHVQSPSLLEMLIQSELETLFKHAKAMAANCDFSSLPIATEHLRRGGLALAHELLGLEPGDESSATAADAEARAWLPAEAIEHADMATGGALQRMERTKRIAYRGSNRHAQARAMRATSRDERLQTVIKTLVELNSMLHTGCYHGKDAILFLDAAFAADESDDEGEFVVVPKTNHTTKAMLDETSVRISSTAWRALVKQTNLYLCNGASSLAQFSMTNNAMLCFASRPRTQYSCGKCSKDFHIFETISHQRMSQCLTCARFWCCECYDELVQKATEKIKKKTITACDIRRLCAEDPGLLLCRECGAVGGAEKK